MDLTDWIAPGVVVAALGLYLTVRDRREAPKRVAQRTIRGEIRSLLVEARTELRDARDRFRRGEELEDFPPRLVSLREQIHTDSERLASSGPLPLLAAEITFTQACWTGVTTEVVADGTYRAADALLHGVIDDPVLAERVKEQLARRPRAETEARRQLGVAFDDCLRQFDDCVAWIDQLDKKD